MCGLERKHTKKKDAFQLSSMVSKPMQLFAMIHIMRKK